jgi:hypothetical protein
VDFSTVDFSEDNRAVWLYALMAMVFLSLAIARVLVQRRLKREKLQMRDHLNQVSLGNRVNSERTARHSGGRCERKIKAFVRFPH